MSEKKLFTPGPLCTSATVKKAMLRDIGSRDIEFVKTVQSIRQQLLGIAMCDPTQYTAVLVQGSGTFAIEAVFANVLGNTGKKTLIISNGAYGDRMAEICIQANLDLEVWRSPENLPLDLKLLEEKFSTNGTNYDLVSIVHCETSTGMINPIGDIGKLVKKYMENSLYFVDAMSSFGAYPIDIPQCKIDFLVSSANKCLEGIPGFAYLIAPITAVEKLKGNCTSWSLDLYAQWAGLERNGQLRTTPPTHSILAFQQALKEFEEEGGVSGRSKRYKENHQIISEGMKKLGFQEFLNQEHASHIITSFYYPKCSNFSFEEFYRRLSDRQQIIYPGKLTKAECFRIGNIGQLFPEDMRNLLEHIENVLNEMNVVIQK